MELCELWCGEGDVCPCALFGETPKRADYWPEGVERQDATEEADPVSTQPRFAWTVEGESHHEHSSIPWRSESHDGVIAADCAGEALQRIVTGGPGTTLDDTIPWDLIDQSRPITITLRPVDKEATQ